MIENLKIIEKKGISEFLEKEKKKWKCPECGGVICCHNGICFDCSLDKLKKKKKLYRWEYGKWKAGGLFISKLNRTSLYTFNRFE